MGFSISPAAFSHGDIMLSIRDIRESDNTAIWKIIRESLEDHGLAIPGSAYFDPQLGDLHGYYNSLPHAGYWVAELDGEVVGGVGIAPFNASITICELQKLYLEPRAQGMGLSRKLLDVALGFATGHYEQCYLETMRSLETACILYEKYDFMPLRAPLPGSGHSAMDAWYLKDLTSS